MSELANLNINQVNTNILSVIGKGNKERKIFLTPSAQKSLATWIQIRNTMDVPTNALFISRNKQRLTTRSIQNVIKKYVIKAGLNSENISTHKLRHTSATLMYKYGHVDIRSLQQILGHESIATTEIYTHVSNQKMKNAADNSPLANVKKLTKDKE